MTTREKIARWLFDEYSDGHWEWEHAPERKRDYYLTKAGELIQACEISPS